MSSLIITIISIALAAALALAGMYFGGDAFNQGSAKAAAATVVNQAQQISGSNTLFFLDEQAYAADVAALVSGDYLASAPNPGKITASNYVLATNGTITLEGLTTAVCDAVNEQAGVEARPADAAAAAALPAQFSCYGDVGGNGTFVFK